MDAFLVPADVRALLDGSAFRLTGPAGADGTGWLAQSTDGSGRRLEVHVVATVLDDVVAARVERLRHVRHEHLPVLHDAVEVGAGRTALVVEHVPGPTLAELRTQRAPLSDGEAATVAIPVASALGALHDAGLAHGAVSPAAVVVRADGRPVLVDLRGVLLGAGTPEGDVRRLVATVLAQIPDADVHLLAGTPGPTLRDALEEAAAVPGVDAGHVVDRCFAVVEPEAVRLPDAGARAALDVARHGAVAGGGDLRRRRRSGRRRRPALLAGAGAAALLLGAVGVGALVDRAWWAPGPTADHAGSGASAGSAAAAGSAASGDDGVLAQAQADPVDVAVALTRRRAEAVASADPALLARVEVVDGPAHRADVALVGALAGTRLDGLVVDVASAELVDGDPVTGAGATGAEATGADVTAEEVPGGDVTGGEVTRADVTVRVTSSMSAHERVPADGSGTVAVPATPPGTVDLVLRWTDGGWRVWDVTAPA